MMASYSRAQHDLCVAYLTKQLGEVCLLRFSLQWHGKPATETQQPWWCRCSGLRPEAGADLFKQTKLKRTLRRSLWYVELS